MKQSAYNKLSSQEFNQKIEHAYKLLDECRLCPHLCKVKRNSGQLGRCRCGLLPMISSCNSHYGEEPPISGSSGSGTIFFTNCNLRCCFCQNYPISQLGNGREISVPELADNMLKLQKKGCHNINFVTPTPWTPQIIEAVKLASEAGLFVPIVYNTSGYDSLEQLRLLDGIVDIYLPDMKYADDDVAIKYSGAASYTQINRTAVLEMYRQVGDLELDTEGVAVSGLIIRHLVLPNNLAGSEQVLKFIAQEVSVSTYMSLMGQYFPAYKALEIPEIARRITREEYQRAFNCLKKFGLENGWVQDDYL